MKAFHITQWDALYETHETRKIRTLTFYAKSNKLIGLGIGRTLQHPQNVALLGTWSLIEALASTAPTQQRGWLVRNGQPLTAADMAYLTRIDKAHFDAAITHFTNPEIGWLEELEFNPQSPGDSKKTETARETAGRLPGESPGALAKAETARETAGMISLRGKIDKREREEGSPERDNKVASPEGLAASKLQWSAVSKRVKELEARGASQTPEDKRELRAARALLRQIEKDQAAGIFAPVQTTGGLS